MNLKRGLGYKNILHAMKENYKAWDVNIDDFYNNQTDIDKLKFLLKFAVLAPSSHNTQPWSFSVTENTIKVYREKTRRLPIADVNDRQLFLSVGCAIENIIVAANYYNYLTEIEYNQDPSKKDLMAVINFKREIMKLNDKNHLIKFIKLRRTNRNKFKNEVIDKNLIISFSNLQIDNATICIIEDREKLSKLSDIAINASINSMEDNGFRIELSHYVKNNLTKSSIGIPGYALGIPTFVSFALPYLIKCFNLEKISKKKNEILLKKYTPYIVLITTKTDESKDWLNSGRLFQRLALLSTKNRISLSPWGAPIQIGEFYKDIQEIVKTSDRPQMFIRMGYTLKTAKSSPRLMADDVIK